MGLGVLVDKDLSIKASGGFIIQMMPDADELIADFVTYRLEEIPSITEFIAKGNECRRYIRIYFWGNGFKILESVVPEYTCDCSKRKLIEHLLV